jgi:hypothetical protein
MYFHGATALEDQVLLVLEASLWHSYTPHSVGLLWTSDQPFDDTHHSQETDIHAHGGARTRNPSKLAVTEHQLIVLPMFKLR